MRHCLQAMAVVWICLGLAMAPVLAQGQAQGEILKIRKPDGYTLGFKDNSSGTLMLEFVPSGQTVDDWMDMITVQRFQSKGDLEPSVFEQRQTALWSGACPESQHVPIRSGEENGYSFSFFLLHCSLSPVSGHSETTFFKVIQGHDAFYAVQKAFRDDPDKSEVVKWSQFLSRVYVCDTRDAERACPEAAPSPN